MKLEVGKAYKMRCGGSVRIDCKDDLLFYSSGRGWFENGNYFENRETPFDLIEEVPFAYGEKVRAWYGDKEDFKIGAFSLYDKGDPLPFLILNEDNIIFRYRDCELYSKQEDEAQELIKRLDELGYSAQITKR